MQTDKFTDEKGKEKICGLVTNELIFYANKEEKIEYCFAFNTFLSYIIIPRRSRRDIVLASSVHPFRLSVHTFCPSRTISQYLLVRFDSFLEKMISTMDSPYPISLVKIDCLTLELLPLFWYSRTVYYYVFCVFSTLFSFKIRSTDHYCKTTHRAKSRFSIISYPFWFVSRPFSLLKGGNLFTDP